MIQTASKNLCFYDYQPGIPDFYAEVIQGLNKRPRAIPPKFYYDEAGSKLFDAICDAPEYYQTRTEIVILKENLDEITQLIGLRSLLIEPGSGNSAKVRILLDAIKPHAYVPMDISGDYLRSVAEGLAHDYPWLDIHATCIDFTEPVNLPSHPAGLRRVAFFPGSSIGNFEPDDAVIFLRNIASMLRPGGGLLIGVDLKKPAAILNAAYNDERGITAQFNLNLLRRINNELGADFSLENFCHKSFYNEKRSRIEMHLISQVRQDVSIGDKIFSFEKEESIHTENSYKYTIDEFTSLAVDAGFSPQKVWTDPKQLFSVHYFMCER